MTNRWQLNRAGLLNFWYYDEELFDFEDGKLLLRGTNGSGKSVTMQSFLPVLLDGKKTPDRLDPFGTKSRKMVDYLLGEKEISDRDERTGYLFLEYKKAETNQFLTTGIGMQAKRNQPLKSWGFVVTDNRRIGQDIDLFKWVNESGEKKKIPYSQIELDTVIGHGGEVVGSNKEYMELVNKHVFGFETLEAFDDMIKLLIQLRSPKLSKDYKPTSIHEILEEALPPLTDEDLRYLSDTVEQMDQTKQQMEQLEREVSALSKLKNSYEQYNERLLFDQITDWQQTKQRSQNESKVLSDLQKQFTEFEAEIVQLTTQQMSLLRSQDTLEEAKARLVTHEVFRLEQELYEKKNSLQELVNEVRRQTEKIDRLVKRERALQQSIYDLEESGAAKQKLIRQLTEDIGYEAEESSFLEHEQNVTDFEERFHEPFVFDLWKREIQQHTKRLEDALEQLKLEEQTKAKIQEKNIELGEVEKARDQDQAAERKWNELLSEERHRLVNNIHLWTTENEFYQIPATSLQEMARQVDDLFTHVEFEQVKALFVTQVHQFEEQVRIKRSQLGAKVASVKAEYLTVENELAEKKAQHDPEPIRHEATIEARKLLADHGVRFAPFYQLIEFIPSVPEAVQKRLESALAETGILDALVSTEEISLQHDRILVANPQLLSHTLADYIQPDKQQNLIPLEKVQDILQSIEMNGEAFVHFTEDGGYKIASLHGHALPNEQVNFIGREARKRYRGQLIAALEEKILGFEAQIISLTEERDRIDQLLGDSKRAWEDFPTSTDAKMCYTEMVNAGERVKWRLQEVNRISVQIAAMDKDLQQIKTQIFHLSDRIYVEKKPTAFAAAVTFSRQYERALDQIHREHEHYIRLQVEFAKDRQSLIEMNEETDEAKGNLTIQEDRQSRITAGIVHLEEQLKLKNAEDIRQQIQTVTADLQAAKAELAIVSEQLPRRKEKRENTAEKMSEKQKSVSFWSKMASIWEDTIEKEWKKSAYPVESNESLDQQLALFMQGKKLKERSALEGQLTTLYHSLQSDLIEHKMRSYQDTSEPSEWMLAITEQEWKPIVEQWRAKTSRTILEFDQRGIKISPTSLYEAVNHEWTMQENRLDEMDKQLYEDILLNSIGYKLRGRIQRAEKWTEKMKRLMESRDTSSGLKFSIQWRPKTADSEQELDTKELVLLLKQDAKLLNERDYEKITNHFRSKIQAAKVWVKEKGQGETLLQVLKMVLDYRKWFSFVLYFERPNEPKRELTNHHFFKFSGGEKAMAMYTPLFAACYSRYQEAAPDAPYIIALDEAFAGVDDNNINEMFEIVEELGFNYIMNSQVLWGDYQAVNSLAICELVRPKNANFVTVIRYKWDGKKISAQLSEVVGAT